MKESYSNKYLYLTCIITALGTIYCLSPFASMKVKDVLLAGLVTIGCIFRLILFLIKVVENNTSRLDECILAILLTTFATISAFYLVSVILQPSDLNSVFDFKELLLTLLIVGESYEKISRSSEQKDSSEQG